ncbi:hypothetical protein BDZ94DRAFT_1239512 [Collybia nuda]|uniref:Uncharacterized protein n=1 Tax=Collybia nuda TaxID=64659 RepID=A0A9P5XWL9_9AGAR|nr:hypothetical protein BDZ94DRAFT_1239512 [Collybia nuda]
MTAPWRDHTPVRPAACHACNGPPKTVENFHPNEIKTQGVHSGAVMFAGSTFHDHVTKGQIRPHMIPPLVHAPSNAQSGIMRGFFLSGYVTHRTGLWNGVTSPHDTRNFMRGSNSVRSSPLPFQQIQFIFIPRADVIPYYPENIIIATSLPRPLYSPDVLGSQLLSWGTLVSSSHFYLIVFANIVIWFGFTIYSEYLDFDHGHIWKLEYVPIITTIAIMSGEMKITGQINRINGDVIYNLNVLPFTFTTGTIPDVNGYLPAAWSWRQYFGSNETFRKANTGGRGCGISKE